VVGGPSRANGHLAWAGMRSAAASDAANGARSVLEGRGTDPPTTHHDGDHSPTVKRSRIFCLTCDRLLRKDCAVNYLVCRLTGHSELKPEAVQGDRSAVATVGKPVKYETGTRQMQVASQVG
jgi:hypothetical protein